MPAIFSPGGKQIVSWFVFSLVASIAFVGIPSELVPLSTLPQMSEGLGVAESEVAFLVGVYALAFASAASPLGSLVGRRMACRCAHTDLLHSLCRRWTH